jgi:hypothetical protein
VLLILLVAGCFGPDRFADRFAERTCTKLRACDGEAFFVVWTDEDDCLEDVAARVERTSDCMRERCDYDQGGAHDCVTAVNRATCEEIESGEAYAACEAVWVGCDGAEGECSAAPPP